MSLRPNLASFAVLTFVFESAWPIFAFPAPNHRGGKLISGSLDSLGLGSLSSFPYSQSLTPTFFFETRHPRLDADCLRDDRPCGVEQGFNEFHRLQATP